MTSAAWTYGPLLFGAALALMLSGIVAVQCIIFFKLYPDESRLKRGMVAVVWLLDLTQSAFILATLVHFFVTHFGNQTVLLLIPWSVALTILLTAIQTYVVHMFYAQKILLTGKNWYVAGPIIVLATLRLVAATASTIEMLCLGHWLPFIQPNPAARFDPHFLFTTGLSLSAGTDALITLCLCYYLRKVRKLSNSSVMNGVLDTLTLYTLENGFITSLTTIAALVFWLTKPETTLALSLHFVIGKLYPNSLLILLNTRKELREMHAGDPGVHVDPLAHYYTQFPHRAPRMRGLSHSHHTGVGVGVGAGTGVGAQLEYTPSREPLVAAPTRAAMAMDQQPQSYRPAFKIMRPVQVKVERTVDVNRTSMATTSDGHEWRQPQPRSWRSHRAIHWPGLP
ncbi:hypothetical protein FB45DRAFT_48006 [Roridomyces roridus]|uniref:DUF6534 domain-containing protein n=1 Tax=Roridomyces roridus TaxID=1738132 RepID=A0AAD7BS81_9AGAR|nr:hypothetical protein FB45DRAFT_48006 [Roridomyces roridus]